MIVQMAKSTQQIILWDVNWSMDLTLAHKTQFSLDVIDEMSDVKGAFDQEGIIFIAHANGVWLVDDTLAIFNLEKNY